MVELTEEDRKKAKELAESWTKKWVESMRKKGKKPTKEGISKYKKTAELMALRKIWSEKFWKTRQK